MDSGHGTLPEAAPAPGNAHSSTEIDGVAVRSEPPSLRKLTFTGTQKLLLLKCARQVDVHRAGHGENDEVFETVLKMFLKEIPAAIWARSQKPSVKTLREKLCAMLRERKSKNLTNEKSCGIHEEVSECDLLLDHLLLEIKEMDEDRRKKRDELNAEEQRWVVAGEELLSQATTRCVREVSKKKRKRVINEEFDTWLADVRHELNEQNKLREEELQARKREVELQEKSFEEDRKDLKAKRVEQSATLELLKA